MKLSSERNLCAVERECKYVSAFSLLRKTHYFPVWDIIGLQWCHTTNLSLWCKIMQSLILFADGECKELYLNGLVFLDGPLSIIE